MTLFETISKRRSVREYNKKNINIEILEDLKAYLQNITQLKNLSVKFEIVEKEKVTYKNAPYYILCYCKQNTLEYINVGFVLQKADLYLQSCGLGSVWLGMPKPKEENGDFAIMLAFGNTDFPIRLPSDFNRLPVQKIANIDNTVTQSARLAPSAMNSQPWFITYTENKVTVEYVGRGITKALLRKKLSKIDIGIVTRHIELALQNEGKTILEINPFEREKTFGVELLYN